MLTGTSAVSNVPPMCVGCHDRIVALSYVALVDKGSLSSDVSTGTCYLRTCEGSAGSVKCDLDLLALPAKGRGPEYVTVPDTRPITGASCSKTTSLGVFDRIVTLNASYASSGVADMSSKIVLIPSSVSDTKVDHSALESTSGGVHVLTLSGGTARRRCMECLAVFSKIMCSCLSNA